MKQIVKLSLNIFIVLVSVLILTNCDTKSKQPELDQPLIIKDGLLYKDSLSTKPFTGTNHSKVLGRTIEYEVVDGVKHGRFLFYFADGTPEIVGQMDKNKNVGEWKYYYQNGTLQAVGEFKEDKPEGLWTFYYPNGKVLEEGMFVKGLRDGKWKTLDSVGTTTIVRTYKEGEMIDSTKNEE